MIMKGNVRILGAVLLAIVALAVYAYVNQLIHGLGVTGMNRPVFWGIYIVTFVFLIGVSAGGIAVASLAHLAGVEKYKSIGRIAEVTAIISLILAMISIFIDLGRPERVLNIIAYMHPLSPLMWDFSILTIYLVLCTLLLWTSLKDKPRLTKIFAYISIPTFVLVHSITAWIFGLIESQPGWYNAIMAPLFICSALVSGLAAVILMVLFARWALNVDVKDDVVIDLGKYFKFLLPILFYLLFCEFLTISYGGIPSHTDVLKEMVGGRFAATFWFDMIGGILIPFLLCFFPIAKTVKGVALIAILSFLGVFAERIDIVLPSFYRPLLVTARVEYFPTWVEASLVAGLFAGGLLMFLISSRIVPLEHREVKQR